MKSVIAIAIVAAGCGSKDNTPPVLTDRGLVVVDHGLEPRGVLRYQLVKGTSTTLAVSMDNDLGSGAGSGASEHMPWPTITTTSEVAADDVLPDGTVRIRYTTRAVSAVDRPGEQVTAAQMNPPLQDVVGTSITGTLSAAGVLGGLAVDTGGKKLPPALSGQVQTLTRALERMVMPLPTEAVGVGALWKFVQPLDQTGMKLTAITTIKATAIQPSSITIVLTSELSGPDQETTAAGPKVKLSGIKGTMRGTGTIDLAHAVMIGELVADLQMDMAADGEKDHAVMTTTLKIAPAAPPPMPTPAPTESSGSGSGSDQGAQNAP